MWPKVRLFSAIIVLAISTFRFRRSPLGGETPSPHVESRSRSCSIFFLPSPQFENNVRPQALYEIDIRVTLECSFSARPLNAAAELGEHSRTESTQGFDHLEIITTQGFDHLEIVITQGFDRFFIPM